MNSIFNMFAKTVVRQQRNPFEISLEIPNQETIAALQEADRIGSDSNTKRYSDFSSLLEEVQNEV